MVQSITRSVAMNQITNHPILFLDIDGVLNNTPSLERMRICDFHTALYEHRPFDPQRFNFVPECLDALRYIFDNAMPSLVISSNWRLGLPTNDEDEVAAIFRNLFRDTFNIGNIPYHIRTIDRSRSESELNPRSHMVDQYLDTLHKAGKIDVKFSNYVVLDDRFDLHKNNHYNGRMMVTDPDVGLTMDQSKRIVEYFNSKV